MINFSFNISLYSGHGMLMTVAMLSFSFSRRQDTPGFLKLFRLPVLWSQTLFLGAVHGIESLFMFFSMWIFVCLFSSLYFFLSVSWRSSSWMPVTTSAKRNIYKNWHISCTSPLIDDHSRVLKSCEDNSIQLLVKSIWHEIPGQHTRGRDPAVNPGRRSDAQKRNLDIWWVERWRIWWALATSAVCFLC